MQALKATFCNTEQTTSNFSLFQDKKARENWKGEENDKCLPARKI